MQTFFSKNAEQTKEIGLQIGSKLKQGDIVLLKGQMGAGKTTMTHGIVQGLGSTDFVSSPTYALVNVYKTPQFEIGHFDLYRLADEDDLYSTGFEDFLTQENVLLIEWSQLAERLLPKEPIVIAIESTGETARKITVSGGQFQ